MFTAKERLNQELLEKEQELQKVLTDLEEKPEFGLGTGSTGAFTWEMLLARREVLEQQIEEIKAALTRIDEGTYGRCVVCGAEIPPERLEIVPTATECAECARKEAAGVRVF
ncbi:MAG: hypothetical protein GXP42_18370 [Chloroflexi bacterium]|nr:hypothetical protein [Chloroflexota bacterium]